MTIGEKRVRTNFNIGDDSTVHTIKAETANLIDICEIIKSDTHDPEVKRLAALAQTAYEEACMWAVKAMTA